MEIRAIISRCHALRQRRSSKAVSEMECVRLFTAILIIAEVSSFSLDHKHQHHSYKFPNGRIISGDLIEIEKAPYQVTVDRGCKARCGGTLINRQIVVTAAHCVIHVRDRGNVKHLQLLVRAGTKEANRGGSRYAVRRIEISPLFKNEPPYFRDIALIYLRVATNLSEKIQPIALAKEKPSDGQKSYVTGDGTLEFMSTSPYYLRGEELQVVPKSECVAKMDLMNTTVGDDQFCAAHKDGHKDTCKGDGGGPMVVNNQLVRITTWGIGCGQKTPGVYTDIAYHKDWIEECSRRLLKRRDCSRTHFGTGDKHLTRLASRRPRSGWGTQRWTGERRRQRML